MSNKYLASITLEDGLVTAVEFLSIAAGDVPLATTSAPGVVQPDGTTVAVAAGVISVVGAIAETAIAGAAAAVINKHYVCSGTSAAYTITLPSPTNNAGQSIWFRMAPLSALSVLVTLDAGSGVTIDGQRTRVMWASESCQLLCDGSNWFKVAGKSIPMIGISTQSTGQSVANTTVTTIQLNTAVADNTGRMVNGSLYTITILRPGAYEISGYIQWLYLTAISTRCIADIQKNGGALLQGGEMYGAVEAYPNPLFVYQLPFVAGDYVQLVGYQNSGYTQTAGNYYVNQYCLLSLVETPQW